MSDCLFCKIAGGGIPSEFVKETDDLVAFRDINPQAPTHVLVIPKKHIPTADDMAAQDAGLVGDMVLLATEIAREEGIAETGYRLVMNCRGDGGQEVFHIHLHLMGGKRLGRMG